MLLRGSVCVLAALVFTLSLGACASPEPEVSSIFAMDTFMELKAYGSGASNALDEAEAYINKLSGLLSVTDEDSEIYAVNHAGGVPVIVSPETFDVISCALDRSCALGDSFDITLYPVLAAWGFTTSSYRVPDEEELVSLLEHVDDSAVNMNETSLTVSLPEGAELDLGAAAKGYAADKCAEIMRKNGVASALLNLGSSTIYALGAKPDGSQWKIAVKDPTDPDEFAGALSLSDAAISTSGGYERYFEGEDGEVYWHIIDPATGRPAKSGLISVTVITSDAFTGDCLSTALFVMGLDRAAELWRARGGFDFIAVTESGEFFLTPGAAEAFTPSEGYVEHMKIVNHKP